MTVYMVVDHNVVTNTIIADLVFVATIVSKHQAINPKIGSEGIGHTYANGLYISQPTSLDVIVTGLSNSASFSVVGNVASGPPSYQWSKDGITISEATNSLYFISSVTNSDVGSYTCQFSNGAHTVTSNIATLTVN